jgi:CheY-like chemotaxis protein
MAQKDPVIVYEHDVYVLSKEGEAELRESETSLSPAEIELLVRTDGKLTVAEVAASARLLTHGAILETYRRLLDGKFVRLRARAQSGSQGIGNLFDVKTPQPSRKAVTKARTEASDGVAALQKQGYFVRIARRDAAKPVAPEEKKLSVIVIEDEPLLAKFLKQYLSFEGMEARLAANRDEILAAFRTPPLPDLVLLDVMLPDADGFDILLKMRQHPVLSTIPVIMLTAKATREAVLKGLAGGADGYVTKPFEADALVKAVKAVLGRKATSSVKLANDAWAQNGR